ncbi:hypothetical protein CF8_0156 [Aeromonas phage CF8]|nr:hypothetical protein CF8_0156 [Aeromonas phage CF8]
MRKEKLVKVMPLIALFLHEVKTNGDVFKPIDLLNGLGIKTQVVPSSAGPIITFSGYGMICCIEHYYETNVTEIEYSHNVYEKHKSHWRDAPLDDAIILKEINTFFVDKLEIDDGTRYKRSLLWTASALFFTTLGLYLWKTL